jgi:hypothetical protein
MYGYTRAGIMRLAWSGPGPGEVYAACPCVALYYQILFYNIIYLNELDCNTSCVNLNVIVPFCYWRGVIPLLGDLLIPLTLLTDSLLFFVVFDRLFPCMFQISKSLNGVLHIFVIRRFRRTSPIYIYI